MKWLPIWETPELLDEYDLAPCTEIREGSNTPSPSPEVRRQLALNVNRSSGAQSLELMIQLLLMTLDWLIDAVLVL